MSTYGALYFHLIWSTKNRAMYISKDVEDQLYKYIYGVVQKNNIKLIQIGGMPDHIHLLIHTKADVNLPMLIKDIKVSSTKMIRGYSPFLNSFSWQVGYGVFSVSKSSVDAVQKYILNQKEHHKTQSFENELIAFLKKHEISFDEKFAFG